MFGIRPLPNFFSRNTIFQNIDWGYFKLVFVASFMYIFDLTAISTVPGRIVTENSEVLSGFLNFPILTLIYVWTLGDLFVLRVLMRSIKRRDGNLKASIE